ncbi:MAG: tryptophan-rich sensory protein [Gemmatimonadota bacterium]|nr:tryptophan-rich sensory protein [Gemmatimonadota bacterium]
MTSAPHPPLRQGLNVVTFVAVLWLNGLAGSGVLSGASIGEIANQYASYFLPANYVFGIWSLIYLGLAAFTVYQALPPLRGCDTLGRLGWAWALNGALNIAWISAFSFGLFSVAWVVMVALLVNLVWIHERIGFGTASLTWDERVFVAWPFGLYLAWISVALISNTFQLVTYLGWNGFGIDGTVWSALLMVVGTGLAAFMVLHRSNWLFPLVFAWAFVGLAQRYADIPLLVTTAYATSALGLVAMVAGLLWRRRTMLATQP